MAWLLPLITAWPGLWVNSVFSRPAHFLAVHAQKEVDMLVGGPSDGPSKYEEHTTHLQTQAGGHRV